MELTASLILIGFIFCPLFPSFLFLFLCPSFLTGFGSGLPWGSFGLFSRVSVCPSVCICPVTWRREEPLGVTSRRRGRPGGADRREEAFAITPGAVVGRSPSTRSSPSKPYRPAEARALLRGAPGLPASPQAGPLPCPAPAELEWAVPLWGAGARRLRGHGVTGLCLQARCPDAQRRGHQRSDLERPFLMTSAESKQSWRSR